MRQIDKHAVRRECAIWPLDADPQIRANGGSHDQQQHDKSSKSFQVGCISPIRAFSQRREANRKVVTSSLL
jgi:hypothetical protein